MIETSTERPSQGRSSGATLAGQLGRLLAKAHSEALAPFDLSPAQFMVLGQLWKTDGLTQSELARRLEVEQATMANTLKRMERDGLILREPHRDNSRAQHIRMSPRAAALKKPAKAAIKAADARAFAGLTRKEQKRFAALSRRVIGVLKGEATATADAT